VVGTQVLNLGLIVLGIIALFGMLYWLSGRIEPDDRDKPASME
jgi:hypothetical protein